MTEVRPAERRQLTVLFCDMVASTPLSLRLDPEELAEVIQAYRQRVGEIVASHGGMVARHVGDGVLAYFGYPRAHENDAERAIRAALAVTRTGWPGNGTHDLRVHVGVATGVMVIGSLPQGGEPLSAIGSTLNLAARLESLAGPGEVVVAQETQRLCRGLFEYRDLGAQALKGFDAPVRAWQVLAERTVGSRFHMLRDRALTPLVDRTAELAQLQQWWALAREGRGQAVLLSSEAGVGKSRLTEALAGSLPEGCVRVWYHCSPNLQGSPLAPVIRQFSIAADLNESDDDATKLAKIAGLVPPELPDAQDMVALLAGLLSVRFDLAAAPLNVSAQRRRQLLFRGLARLVAAVARARGALFVVVEDLHWVDPSFDELIGMVLPELADLPILAVLTARPEFRPHWGDAPHLHTMVLQPLSRADAMTMVGHVCGEQRLPEATMREIAERTDGMPLFIEDLTRSVLESGPGAGAPRFAIPATLNDALMSRLDRLGPAKAIAEIGAVIGREWSYELLARVAGLPEETLKEELSRLVDAGLLVSPKSPVLAYAFKHALVRDAAYASLLRKQQAALHARIAQVLVEDFPETAETQPELLAWHFQAAGDADRAVDHLVAAAKLSARRSGFTEAIAQLEAALRLLASLPASHARARRELAVHRTLGGIYAEQRGFASAECGRAYETALALCREVPDAPEIFSVLAGLGSYEITRAGFATCRALAQECLARAAEQVGKPPFVMGHLLLGGTLFLEGELAAARGHLEAALRLYEEGETAPRPRQVMYVQDQKSTGLCYLALALTLMGDVEAGLRAAEEGLAHSRALGGLHTVNFSLCYCAAVDHIRGDPRAALDRATASLASAREQGFATWIGISQSIRGASMVKLGQQGEGLVELARGMEAHAATDAVTYQPFAIGLYGEALTAAGQLSRAHGVLARAVGQAQATGERFYLAELLRLQGEAFAASGEHARAKAALREAIATAQAQGASLFERRCADTRFG
ncbi:MAG: AAA family ATPase [Burkholderiales bacterium]|nr:AAA family ATPase [Burkholderiales bacterium]